ncbi:hypothetical protein RI367_003537 [Sorochytrium milnesiophthora]
MTDTTTLAVLYCERTGALGAAYLTGDFGTLHVVEDVVEDAGFSALQQLKYQVVPQIILCSSRATDALIDACSSPLADDGDAEEITVQVRPAAEFSATSTRSQAVRFLEDVELPVDASSQAFGAIGALLAFVSKHTHLHISHAELLNLETFLHIDNASLLALNVFDDCQQMLTPKSTRASQHATSVFGNKAGRMRLRLWLLRPLRNGQELNARHDAVEQLMAPEHAQAVSDTCSSLKHIKNIVKALAQLNRQQSINDWQVIYNFARHAGRIAAALWPMCKAGSLLAVIQSCVNESTLERVASLITSTIDFAESARSGRVAVNVGVDEQLDDLKRTYEGLPSLLSTVAEEVAHTLPQSSTQNLNVIYFPQLGYLIALPSVETAHIDSGLVHQFSTATNSYYKNDKMHELDSELGDIYGLIVDKEIEILQSVKEAIDDHSDSLAAAHSALMNLDWHVYRSISVNACSSATSLLSFAQASTAYRYVRPVLEAESSAIDITQGRHPLQEHLVPHFVANDTSITPHQPPVVVLSGPNFSGKSVYLKQVALIIYMAHIGCFVPAQTATLGLTDRILTRLQTRESVTAAQSAFMIDLSQVQQAIAKATSRSLVLLDEFGKGTSLTDGVGMFVGVVNHFLRKRQECPRVLATTHFHEPSYLTMQVYCDGDVNDLTFLYRVAPGRAEQSLGAFCALTAGIPDDVVKRASEASRCFATFRDVPALSESTAALQHKEAARLQAAREFLALLLDDPNDVDILWSLPAVQE